MSQEKITQAEIDAFRKAQQAAYAREWRKNNPEKVKATKERYWRRKALEARQKGGGDNGETSEA